MFNLPEQKVDVCNTNKIRKATAKQNSKNRPMRKYSKDHEKLLTLTTMTPNLTKRKLIFVFHIKLCM